MSIITKTGDDGATALMFNRRVSKCDPRVEACGAVDELNAALGLARATAAQEPLRETLALVQNHLIALMGELATALEDHPRYLQAGFASLDSRMTAALEGRAKEIEAELQSFHGWATPGTNLNAAALDLARTTCRRAERRVCALHEAAQLPNAEILVYLNRLSDLLWLLARQSEADAVRRS